MEALVAQMQADRHDPMTTGEAQTSVVWLRQLETAYKAAELSAASASAAFRVDSVPVNVNELRRAYTRTIQQVARLYDQALAKEQEYLKRAEHADALAAECEASDDEAVRAQAAQHRATAEEYRRKAALCATAAMVAGETLGVLRIGLRGLARCKQIEDAHASVPGGPAQRTDTYKPGA
jgi:hypothetical protein